MTNMMLISVSILLFAISIASAEDNISIDPVVGTWINTDYNDNTGKYGKFIVKPDYSIEAFDDPTRTNVPRTFTFIVEESWSDIEGNMYYNMTFKRAGYGRITYELWKLDSSQTVLESMWGSAVEHPKEIKVGHSSYRIHYRQE